MTDSNADHPLPTEQAHPQAMGLDARPAEEVLKILHAGQVAAAQSVEAALPALAKGAEAMAQAVRTGRQIVYGAAGSSGLMGLADGLEIHPTFGIPIAQIKILRAGGLEDIQIPKGQVEDDIDAARADAEVIGAGDCVICLAASGNTPYAAEILRMGRARGATTIGISNNADTILLREADIPVHLPTPPEVIAGSTRMGAGTAQKMALNTISTQMGVLLGHVMDGLMVNVVANNVKLFDRAERIVCAVTGGTAAQAKSALAQADGRVKEAALIVAGADLAEAERLLAATQSNLRAALARINAG